MTDMNILITMIGVRNDYERQMPPPIGYTDAGEPLADGLDPVVELIDKIEIALEDK